MSAFIQSPSDSSGTPGGTHPGSMTLSPKSKRLLGNCAVLLGALLATLLLLEIGFRLWAHRKARRADPVVRMGAIVRPSADPALVYEYIPGPPHCNATGMRAPELAVEKPPHTIRIAGLGDSVMAGDFYRIDQLFMNVLGRLLNEAATPPVRFETLNFAVGGYNTAQEAIVLKRKALAYAPDLVLLGVVINDCERPVYYQAPDGRGGVTLRDRYQDEKRRPFSDGLDLAAPPWWSGSVLVRWLHFRLTQKRRFFEGIDYFRTHFRDIAATCRARGVPLLAVLLTEEVEVGKPDPRAAWHAIVREAARQENVLLFETFPAIQKRLAAAGIASYRRYWSSPQDPHPNADGHRLIAELLFEDLKEMHALALGPL